MQNNNENSNQKLNKRRRGALGEEHAARFLESQGITIIERNYFTKFGEIDLIGLQNRTIIFIEVKLRTTNTFGHPLESITRKKWQAMQKAALMYVEKNSFFEHTCRFDIISIILHKTSSVPDIEWLKDQYFY